MFDSALAAYAVAFFAMLLAATSAVALITVVRHFDPPDVPPSVEHYETAA